MTHETIFAGFGGQGVLTGGLTLAYTALRQGRKVTWLPAYGGSMRGGKANSTVKFGDEVGENTGVPMMSEAEVLVAMNQPALDYRRFCLPEALVLVNTDAVEAEDIPEGDRVIRVACDTIAYSVQNPKGSSLVMLGVLARKLGWFPPEAYETGIRSMLEEKGKMSFLEANLRAFHAGWDLSV